MPIQLTPYTCGTLCYGSTWVVPDDAVLANYIAKVAIGQYRHVAKILAGGTSSDPNVSAQAKVSALKLLAEAGGENSHRDGWLFQTMSWIAAAIDSPHAILRLPHMIHAHKGFDGLQLELQGDTDVIAVVVFEDKATDNPRSTIRSRVWPDFRELEDGDRENLLVADVTSLLATSHAVDADAAIRKVIWGDVRRYRVSITIGATYSDYKGRSRLFKGYDSVAGGDVVRRRGETFFTSNLRRWLDTLATKVGGAIKAL